jgi:hypothetical protein
MARETLDRKIRHLLDEILVLDSLVEAGLIESVEALKKRDLELARRVMPGTPRSTQTLSWRPTSSSPLQHPTGYGG